MRQIYAGVICIICHKDLPERTDGRTGERKCAACFEKSLVTVFMTFIHRDCWHVAFLMADARTSLPWKKTYRDAEPLYRMVKQSYQPAVALAELERCIVSWGQGSVKMRLTPQQYGMLNNGTIRRPTKP